MVRGERGLLRRERAGYDEKKACARFFPTTGGILKTMQNKYAPDYTYLAVDGVENCIAALNDIEERATLQHCFIEMSACAGSCIGGPVMEKYHRIARKRLLRRIALCRQRGL